MSPELFVSQILLVLRQTDVRRMWEVKEVVSRLFRQEATFEDELRKGGGRLLLQVDLF